MSSPDRQRFELHIPTSTILKALGTTVLVWAGVRLWPEVLLLLVSAILAIALEPTVNWLNKKRLPRGVSVMILAALLVSGIGLLAAFVLPQVLEQVGDFIRDLPELRRHIRDSIEPENASLRQSVDSLVRMPSSETMSKQLGSLLMMGQATLSGLAAAILVLIVTLYLILDGRRLYAWLLAYVPLEHRCKMAETVPAVSSVIRAYVRGQLITSFMFGVFSAVVLAAFHVPAVVPLALLAALCDVLPVIGIIISTVPAALLALAVSPWVALGVTTCYLVYHQFENYFLVPRVYGSAMRMSTLTVLLALIVAGSLQGILGAALILPIVAAYPTIERIWLGRYLGRRVIADHDALANAMESGDDQAIEDVLHAEEHERASAAGSGDSDPHPEP
jgi:predicted PurR-regulated permease PerM